MKVAGETLSLSKKKKRSRRGKILNVSKLSGKRTVTGQNSGALYRDQGENKKKGGVTVKKYYIFKNIFNNKERTNVKEKIVFIVLLSFHSGIVYA